MSKKILFSSTEDELLIKFVQQSKDIFDSTHPKHKDDHLKEKIWKHISKKVGRTDEDCIKRWTNIRDTYMKQKKILSTSEKLNRSLSHLSLMDSVEYERKTTSNVDNREIDNSTSTVEDGNYLQNDNGEDTLVPEDLPSASSYRGKLIRSKENKHCVILAKRLKERDTLLSKIQAHNEILVPSINNQQEDSVDQFFKSISTIVKKLPRRAINEAKLQILTLVSQLEKKYCNFQQLPQNIDRKNKNDCVETHAEKTG